MAIRLFFTSPKQYDMMFHQAIQRRTQKVCILPKRRSLNLKVGTYCFWVSLMIGQDMLGNSCQKMTIFALKF